MAASSLSSSPVVSVPPGFDRDEMNRRALILSGYRIPGLRSQRHQRSNSLDEYSSSSSTSSPMSSLLTPPLVIPPAPAPSATRSLALSNPSSRSASPSAAATTTTATRPTPPPAILKQPTPPSGVASRKDSNGIKRLRSSAQDIGAAIRRSSTDSCGSASVTASSSCLGSPRSMQFLLEEI